MSVYLTYQDDDKLPYKEMCNALWNLQRQVRAGKNKAISELYQNLMWKSEVKRETGSYPNDVDRYGMKLGQYVYREMKAMMPDIQTGNLASVQHSLEGKFKCDTIDILKGTKSIASFKENQPIDLHHNNITICDDGTVVLSLFSKDKTKELGLKNGLLKFKCYRVKGGQKEILDRCVSGEYTYGSGSLSYDKRKKMWKLTVVYDFDAKTIELDSKRICGVDLGIVHPFYCAVSDGYDRLSSDGGQIEAFRVEMERRRRSVLSNRKFASQGSVGHGYKKRTAAVDRFESKVKSFRNTVNENLSKAIVDFAVKNRCGTIQMEDLSGIGENSKFLKRWPYYDLQQKTALKAKVCGIDVVKVEPKYTSQRCHQCGYIDKENRPTQAEFECKRCGYKGNADYNAAKNLSVAGIDEIIKHDLSANMEYT